MIGGALFLPWWHALLGRRAWLAVPIGALIAAALALDPVLGPEDGLGVYLAYVSLFPAALAFRLGAAVDARRRDGLELEETLRDPAGRRAPAAALLAAGAALAAGLAVCAMPPLLLALAREDAPPRALHPVQIAKHGADGWSFDASGALPPHTNLLLVFRWESLPEADAALRDGAGREHALRAGETIRVPLALDALRSGRVELQPNPAALNARPTLVRPLVRLEIPRPPLSAAPRLLARQWSFAAPLLALVLLLARRWRTGGSLAALAAIALGGLAAFDPLEPPRLGHGPADLLARAVLALRSALPDVRGLAATGRGFELRSGTTDTLALLLWILLGTLFWLLCFWPRRPRS